MALVEHDALLGSRQSDMGNLGANIILFACTVGLRQPNEPQSHWAIAPFAFLLVTLVLAGRRRPV
jgi:hypothetical protein